MTKKSAARERKAEKREDRAADRPVEHRDDPSIAESDDQRQHMPTPVRAERHDDADAFLPDPEDGPMRTPDDLAEMVAEEFVTAATSGEDVSEDTRDAMTLEELGGP